MAANWRFQIYHQKLRGTEEIYDLLQHWGLKEPERNADLRNPGIARDVHEDSILVFSFHLDETH